MNVFKRPVFNILYKRILEKRQFIQILAGPRQVGKTTLVRQLADKIGPECLYVSADEPTLQDRNWLTQQWDAARLKTQDKKLSGHAILVIDEIQKIPDWSETVKHLWDEDTRKNTPLKVILLGSSPLLMQKGLTESLAGRFELIPATHWSWPEMHDCFGYSVDDYIFYGGYPGAAGLRQDFARWSAYIRDSLIETTVSRDILLLTRVDKPALLRRTFLLGCEYSGQILSYQKMVGQLQDTGNTSTMAHYLELLAGAGLLTGLSKYAGQKLRRRASSPKLLAMNTGLISALMGMNYAASRSDHKTWGRLVESAVGAHLVNSAAGSQTEVYYWNESSREVDFVLARGKQVTAIEVKGQPGAVKISGMDSFCSEFPVQRQLLVGGQGISLEEFLSKPADYWLET
jgi:predicted AAA+ superfamily ATPase